MWAILWFATVVSCAEVPAIDNNVARNNENAEHVVETESGRIRGIVEDNIINYFDIPYGNFSEDNPFQEPIAPLSWQSILENTAHTSRCPQIDLENKYVGSTDCLTLSIFVPENATNADVLFHIHDNSFHNGSGDPSKYSPNYLANQDIILVLPNYRIGPLGFLCLQNESAPGNAGLKDLFLALQWTKKNINAFGGNNSNIVISGSGVAGALVEYLLLSNNSRSLISKAIIESGFALSPWALDRHPIETATSLVKELEKLVDNGETESIYSVFNQNNLERLVRAARNLNFFPCIEKGTGFLTESPWHLINNEKTEIIVMSGSANQAAMDKALTQTEGTLSQINEDFSLLLPNDLKFNNDEEKGRIGRQVRTQYFGENNITTNDMERLSQCYSDSQYLYHGIRSARLLIQRGATVYFYEFSYGSNHPVNGSVRGDTLNYVFSRNEDATENNVNNIMSNLWASFIKFGRPTVENIEWTNLTPAPEYEEVWLSIGDNVVVKRGFHHERLKVWNDIYQNHFVERNLALKLKSSVYITLLSSLFLLLDISFNVKI